MTDIRYDTDITDRNTFRMKVKTACMVEYDSVADLDYIRERLSAPVRAVLDCLSDLTSECQLPVQAVRLFRPNRDNAVCREVEIDPFAPVLRNEDARYFDTHTGTQTSDLFRCAILADAELQGSALSVLPLYVSLDSQVDKRLAFLAVSDYGITADDAAYGYITFDHIAVVFE